MKFIIHSKQLLDMAIQYEKEIGERCYIPVRDTPQTHGDSILPLNHDAMKGCENEVLVIWDGMSMGTMFDMGMAYAMGKTLKPLKLVCGRTWQDYFASKVGDEIAYRSL